MKLRGSIIGRRLACGALVLRAPAALACAAVLLCACEKSTVITSTTRPATVPAEAIRAATAPATSPTTGPATVPAVAAKTHLSIDNVDTEFPNALLTLHQSDGGVLAKLHSDDPADVLNGLKGNSFYFQITFPGVDVNNVNNQIGSWYSASMEQQEDTIGVFLDGRNILFQPHEVRLYFSVAGNVAHVTLLNGSTFLKFDRDATHPPRLVHIEGTITAQVKIEK